jgi:hypothetical protein
VLREPHGWYKQSQREILLWAHIVQRKVGSIIWTAGIGLASFSDAETGQIQLLQMVCVSVFCVTQNGIKVGIKWKSYYRLGFCQLQVGLITAIEWSFEGKKQSIVSGTTKPLLPHRCVGFDPYKTYFLK